MKKWNYILLLSLAIFGCKKNTVPRVIPPEVPPGHNYTAADSALVIKSFTLNSAIIPFDKNSLRFHYPTSSLTPSQDTLRFTTDVASVSFEGAEVANNSTVALPLNKSIKVHIINKDNKPFDFNLVVTGLPIVNMTTKKTITDEITGITFILIDPDYQLHKGQPVANSFATINVRGASSRTYPKKSLALKTTDADFEKADLPLLGLRDDNSWILDAMYADVGRMRNRVCTDLWNTMNNVPYFDQEKEALNGTRGYMVEVFKDNEYLGLYCLTEKVDRKQLKIKKKTGVMYKADYWAPNVSFVQTGPYDNSKSLWGGWAFDYPQIGDDPAPDWKPLYDLTTFVVNSSDSEFKKEIGNKIDIDNIIDYYLFINAIGGGDNTSKNAFINAYDLPESKFFFSVWDLDGTLGRTWDAQPFQTTTFDFLGKDHGILSRLFNLNPDGFRAKLKARWNVLKNDQLSKSKVNERLTYYYKQITLTGAGEREKAKWSNTQNFDTEAAYMTNWYSQHYDALDSFISAIPGV